MSLKLLSWAFEQDLPCAEKIVLLALADMADMDGKCWPSQTHLAKRCGIVRETVNRQIKKLVSAGMLRVEHRADRDGQHSNVYFVRCDAGSHVTQDHVTKDHSARDGRSLGHVTDDHTEPSLRTFKESPPVVPRRGTTLTDFEKWWEGYPAKIGKGAAERAWARACKQASAGDMIAGVSRYIANKPEDRDWCHPATWLNQKRWLDDFGDSEQRRIKPTSPPPRLENGNAAIGRDNDRVSQQGALQRHSQKPAEPELFRSDRY